MGTKREKRDGQEREKQLIAVSCNKFIGEGQGGQGEEKGWKYRDRLSVIPLLQIGRPAICRNRFFCKYIILYLQPQAKSVHRARGQRERCNLLTNILAGWRAKEWPREERSRNVNFEF